VESTEPGHERASSWAQRSAELDARIRDLHDRNAQLSASSGPADVEERRTPGSTPDQAAKAKALARAAAVERRGGVVAIQDPSESAYDGMPRAAIAATRRARVLRLPELAAFIDRESRHPVSEQTVPPDPDLERQLSVFLEPIPRSAAEPNPWSGVTCPECGGPLRQEDTSVPVRFECRIGHGWSPESLLVAQAAGIERALWAAVLRLEERSRLHQVLAQTAEDQGYPISAAGFRASALSARSSARKIRVLLESPGEAGDSDDSD
jgi:two-component system, chemotaxis family, protein-glutamate methylesterase/glutaminase